MRRFICAILLSLNIVNPALGGQEKNYDYARVSLEEGLANPHVTAIYKDSGGAMWFGTEDTVERFTLSGHSCFSVSRDVVTSIGEDSSGMIWVTTSEHVFILDSGTDSLKEVLSVPGARLLAIGDEMLLFCDNALVRFKAGSTSPLSRTEFPSNIHVQRVTLPEDGIVLLASEGNGIWRYDLDSGQIDKFSDNGYRRISCLYVKDSIVYCGYYGGGLVRFSMEGEELGRVEGLGSEYIMDMAWGDGRLWICTDLGGITLLDTRTMQTTVLKHVPGDPESFPSNSAISICADVSNDMWVGTVRNGAFNIHRRYIRTYGETHLGGGNGLSERCAFGLYEDSDGILWIGTDGQGINRYDPVSGQFTHYPGTFGEYIPSITAWSEEELLVTRYGKGLALFDKKDGTLKKLDAEGPGSSDESSWRSDWTTEHKVAPDKVFVFSTHSFILNPQNGKVKMISFENGIPADNMNKPVWYCRDFILCCRGNELYVNNLENSHLKLLGNVGWNGNITAISYDKNSSRIWTGTDNGVGYFELDPESLHCGHFTKIEGIPVNGISAVSADRSGRIWMASRSCLHFYDPFSGEYRKYGEFDGFGKCVILGSCVSGAQSDCIYWTGTSGLVCIDCSIADLPPRLEDVTMELSEVRADDKKIKCSGRATIRVPYCRRNLVLDYKVSGLRFFESSSYVFTITNDNKTVLTTFSPTLNLTSMAPGRYGIMARCGQESDGRDALSCSNTLVISPPWYKSVWFILPLILLVLSVAVATTYKYVRSQTAKDGMVENAISEKDRDFVRNLDKYIDSHFDSDLSADALVDVMCTSRAVLYRKVKAVSGYSLNEYVKRYRINKAAELLATTGMNINEISDSVGFAYPRTFSSVFKEMTGMTPSEYRKKSRKQS